MTAPIILGSKGTLGTQLQRLYPSAAGWDREDVDVRDFPSLTAKIERLGGAPDAILNCIAFNDVDSAENRPDDALALNADFPARLAAYTRAHGIRLVHFSTNYVFDGAKGEYAEDDPPSPLSVYGRTKVAGERPVIESGGYVVRTAVIFGPRGASELSKRSFVDLMLDLSEKRDTVQAVSDEVNSVTYSLDLAAATRALLEAAAAPGIYHVANSGAASWCDLAGEIFRVAGRRTTAIPVPASQFPRKGMRPPKSVLLNTKLPPLRPWQEALAEFLRA
jgi:dTDP-4-dehydrorhamnose reductase